MVATSESLANALIVAWAQIGEGKMSEALRQLRRRHPKKGFEAFGYFHKALALARSAISRGPMPSFPARPLVQST